VKSGCERSSSVLRSASPFATLPLTLLALLVVVWPVAWSCANAPVGHEKDATIRTVVPPPTEMDLRTTPSRMARRRSARGSVVYAHLLRSASAHGERQ
jgi:hypothetical protein